MDLKLKKLDISLLLLRLAAGWIFIAEGYIKLFVIGRTPLASYFSGLGLPFPQITGITIGFLEFFGGIFLLSGFLTRVLGWLFAIEMLVATLVANLPQGFSAPLQITTLLFFITLVIGIMGGGTWSIDHKIKNKK